MIIGITGTVGSGKSTVSKIFESHGFQRIDADEIGHKLLEKFTPQYRQLVGYFGNQILDVNGNIDRKVLGDIAFSQFKKYRKLNSIMIPPIVKEIRRQVKDSSKNYVIDAPLLLETGAKDIVDVIVVVRASGDKILQRNRKLPKERILKIKKLQMPLASKLQHAHYVINNNGNINSLGAQVKNIIKAANNKV